MGEFDWNQMKNLLSARLPRPPSPVSRPPSPTVPSAGASPFAIPDSQIVMPPVSRPPSPTVRLPTFNFQPLVLPLMTSLMSLAASSELTLAQLPSQNFSLGWLEFSPRYPGYRYMREPYTAELTIPSDVRSFLSSASPPHLVTHALH